MIDILVNAITNFGVSSLASNIGTNLIVKSDKKWLDKVAIGLGTFIVSTYVEDKIAEHFTNKINSLKDDILDGGLVGCCKDVKEDEDGGEISE